MKLHNNIVTHFYMTVMLLALWNFRFKTILLRLYKIKSTKYIKYQNLIHKIAKAKIISRLILSFVHSPAPVRFQEYAYAFHTIQPNKLLLDIGSGFSCFPSFVARYKGIDVICMDLNAEAIKQSKEISKKMPEVGYRMQYIIADAEYLPFRDTSIPQICSVSVLEHVTDDRRCSAEIGRVLSSGGICCMTLRYSCVTKKHRYQDDGSFERFYTDNTIKTRILAPSHLELKHFRLIEKQFASIIFRRLHYINSQENPILAILARKLDEFFFKTSKDALGIVLTMEKHSHQ